MLKNPPTDSDDLGSIEPPPEPIEPERDWQEQPTRDGGRTAGASTRANTPGLAYDAETLAFVLGSLYSATLLQHVDIGGLKGRPSKVQPVTAANVKRALNYLGLVPRLNMMDCTIDFDTPPRIDRGRFGTLQPAQIGAMLMEAFCDAVTGAGLRNRDAVRKMVVHIAAENRWHPMKDWIEAAPWDGQDRFQALLDTVTTDQRELFRTYFRRWALQTVEAVCGWPIRQRQMKALVLVLSGPQRIGKTSWLMALAPGFGKDGCHLALNGPTAKDSKHEALQFAITELGELEVTFKRSDIALIKGFISGMVDNYRLPYREQWTQRPRTTSFCGSVNDDEFLVDDTGNGRFCPVKVTRCDALHGIDMAQFWAQVRTWWAAGEQWWLTPEEEAAQTVSNRDFEQSSGVAQQIGAFLEPRREGSASYPCPAALSSSELAKLLGLRWDQMGLLRSIGRAVKEVLGPHRDYRHQVDGVLVGRQKAWLVHISSNEAEAISAVGPDGLLIEKAAPPTADWASKAEVVTSPRRAKRKTE